MKEIRQLSDSLLAASRLLAPVSRKPALLAFWLTKPPGKRLLLYGGLAVYLVLAYMASQALVDRWHPPEQGTFTTSLMEALDSPLLRQLKERRRSSFRTTLATFWLVGIGLAMIWLLRELPRAIADGASRSAELMRQSAELSTTNPLLADSLSTTARKLRLEPGIETPASDPDAESSTSADASRVEAPAPVPPKPEISKTVAGPPAARPTRYIGPDRRYRIEKAIASGGAGIVYRAEDTVLGRQVALKELLEDVAADPEQAERFKQEARALALLNHPNIMPIYDLLQEKGHFWLVSELLTGGTLGDRIAAGTPMETRECIRVVRGIAVGLAFAHDQGFVHRDIKPANILFAADGSFRITDFGIAKHQSLGVKTSHGLVLGSPGYMSPEQAAGQPVDTRSDLYSLGVTLWQMLTSRLPFEGEPSAVMSQHITQEPAPPSLLNEKVGPGLDRVVMTLLAKRPDDRFQSATDLIDALDKLD